MWNHATHQGIRWRDATDGGVASQPDIQEQTLCQNDIIEWYEGKKTQEPIGRCHFMETEGSSKVMDYQIKEWGCPCFVAKDEKDGQCGRCYACEWQLPKKKQDLHLSLKNRFFLVKMWIVIIFAKEKVGDTS